MPKSKEKTNNQKQGRNPKSDNCDWWNPDCMHFCDAKYAPLTGKRKEAAAEFAKEIVAVLKENQARIGFGPPKIMVIQAGSADADSIVAFVVSQMWQEDDWLLYIEVKYVNGKREILLEGEPLYCILSR